MDCDPPSGVECQINVDFPTGDKDATFWGPRYGTWPDFRRYGAKS